LKGQLPHLFSFSTDESFSVDVHTEFVNLLVHTENYFHLPVSVDVHTEFVNLLAILDALPIPVPSDKWTVFGSTTVFQGIYNMQIGDGRHIVCPALKWTSKSCSKSQHKVFFWLRIQERLNTRQLWQRKNFFLSDYSCTMCNSSKMESGNHLFFTCPFTIMCWQYICPSWAPPNALLQQTHVIIFIDMF
jgi:hypothetical protein